jgi:hypothetical protein
MAFWFLRRHLICRKARNSCWICVFRTRNKFDREFAASLRGYFRT